jgi:hypothetical protein
VSVLSDSLISSVVALTRFPNFFKEMQAQAQQLIQPLAALASLHNSRMGTYIKVRFDKIRLNDLDGGMENDPMCRERPLTEALRDLEKRLSKVMNQFALTVLLHRPLHACLW